MYATITILLYPFSFGPLQLRVSEALCVLALLTPEGGAGIVFGCLIANVFSPSGPLDLLFGTLASALASLACFGIRKTVKKDFVKLLTGILAVTILNAAVVPIGLLITTSLWELYALTALQIGMGELITLCALGVPLYFGAKRMLAKRKTDE